MATIKNEIRWADNTEELRRNLLNGVGTLDAMRSSVDRTIASLGGQGLFLAANRAAAAVTEMGGATKLTSAEQERINGLLERALEKYEAMGMKVPPQMRAIADATRDVARINAETWQKSIDGLNSFSSAAKTTGVALSAAVTAPLVGFGGAAIKASMDVETAFAGVRKTVSGTPAELDKINEQFREMARVTPMSVVELSKIGEMAGQLGVHKDKIATFTKTIVDISTATTLTADEAGSSFARLANVLKMPQESFSNLGSAVVALGNFGASTEQEMLSMAQRIAAAAATANMTAPQVLGIANALSSVGIEAEAGGTAVSRVINKIGSDVASGGGKLDTFAKVAGLSAKAFQKAWHEDAGAAFSKFMQGLSKARESGGDQLLGLMDELGFKEVRLRNAFMAAANAGSLMADSIALGTKAFNENKELVRASEERYKTAANQLKVLWNNVTDVAITIGDVLVPMLLKVVDVVKPMVDTVRDVANEFKAMPGFMQFGVVAMAGVAAAAGPLILAAGGVAFSIGQVMTLMAEFPAIGAAAAAATEALTTGMLGMVATAAGVLALVAAVGTLAYGLTRVADVASGGKLSGWLTPFIAGTQQLALATQEAGAGQDAMNLAVSRGATNIHTAAEALQYNTDWLQRHNAALKPAVDLHNNVSAATKTLADRIKELTADQRDDIVSKRDQHETLKAIAAETGITQDVVSGYLKTIASGEKAHKQFIDAWKDLSTVGGSWRDTLDGIDGETVEAVKYYLAAGAAQGVLEKAYGLTAVQVHAISDALKDEKAWLQEVERQHKQTSELAQQHEKQWRDEIGKTAAARNKALTDAFAIEKDYLRKTADLSATAADTIMRDWADALNKLGPPIEGFEQQWHRSVDSIAAYFSAKLSVSTMAAAVKAAGDSGTGFRDTFIKKLEGIPDLLSRAFTGGGGLAGAAKAIGGELASSLGDEIATGPIGQHVADGFASVFHAGGKAAGAIAHGVSGAINAAVSLAGSGSFGEIASYTTAGASIGFMIGNGIGAAIGAGVGAIVGIIKSIGADEKQINAIRESFVIASGGIDELDRAAKRAGVDLHAFLNAKDPADYERALKSLTDAIAFQDSAMNTLDQTVKKYGFTIEELGPALQHQNLDKQAAQLWQDWQVLNAAGIDTVAITTRMGSAINDYFQAAMKTHTEIPAAMKPMLQAMIDAGTLTDANGNKITDLGQAGVTFSETMTEGFNRVVDVVKQLTDAIARGLGLAIQNIPPVDVTGTVHWNVDPAPRELAGDALPMADGGAGLVTRPTLFLAGEAGPEEYAFSGANRSLRSGNRSNVIDFSAMKASIDAHRQETAKLRRDLNRRLPDAIGVAVSDNMRGR